MLRSASGLRIRYRCLLRCHLRCLRLRLRTKHNKMGGDGEESGGGGASSPPHPSSPAAAGVGGWQAFQDDEGRTYYYHAEREETQWEAPEGFVPAAPGARVELGGRDQGAVPGGAADAAADAATGARAAPAQEQAPATAQDERRWVGYRDDEGRTYYFNEATGETQWERPAEGPDVVVVEEEDMEAEAFEADASSSQQQTGDGGRASSEPPMEEGEYVADDGAMEVDDGETVERKAGMEVEEQVPEEEMKDPRQVALEKAEEALTARDAVMELGESFLHVYVCDIVTCMAFCLCYRFREKSNQTSSQYLTQYCVSSRFTRRAYRISAAQTASTTWPSSSISSAATSAVPRRCRPSYRPTTASRRCVAC